MYNTIVTLKKGEGRTIKSGGAWIFDNEIETIMGRFTNGDIVTVHDFDGYPMGNGFINQNSAVEHAYSELRRIENKPSFLILYQYED